MMREKCSHEQNRIKVCASCGHKIYFGKKKSEYFKISSKQEAQIKKFLNKNFNLSDDKYPLGLCVTCRLTLSEHDKGITKRILPQMPNYLDIKLPKTTRSSSDLVCDCFICSTGQFTGYKKLKNGRGHVKQPIHIQDSKESNRASNNIINAVAKNKTHQETNHALTVCSTCFMKIKNGKYHECSRIVDKKIKNPVKNMLNLIEELPENDQEKVLSSMLKRKRPVDSNDLVLKSGGKSTRILVNPKIVEPATFSSENLNNYKAVTRSSTNQMKKFLNFLRCNIGRKCLPPNYQRIMVENSNKLDDLYKDGIYEFETSQEAKVKRPVIWADAEELLDRIIEERKLNNDINVKIMADGGKGFFKISISVFPEKCELDLEEENNNLIHKNLYANGGIVGKEMSPTSVYKLILICVVPDIKETYNNMKLLFELTKINNIPFKFSADFKIILLVNGLQTATASFPCPYCFISLTELRNKTYICDEATDSDGCDNDSRECMAMHSLRTYGNLINDHNNFLSSGNGKKQAKNYHSTVNPPLFEENENTLVLQKCVIPELHILQGFVNHMFFDGLVPLLGEEKAILWPSKVKVVPKNYQGVKFEGNACRKLLKSADALNDSEIYENVGIFALIPYISTLKVMDKIVNRFFSSKNIEDEPDKYINELRKAYAATGISETLKMHVLFEHLKDCLRCLNGSGLGLWSEQAGETVHSIFFDYWEKHKINFVNDESYSKRLKKAVVEFSSQHM